MVDRDDEEGTEPMRKAVKVLAGLRGRILNRWPDWGPEAEPSLQPPPSLWGTVRRANGGRRRAAGPEKLLARMGSFASTSTGGGMEEDVDREGKLKVAKDEVTTGAAPSEMSSPDTPLDFAAAGGSDADASSSGESGGDKGCARAAATARVSLWQIKLNCRRGRRLGSAIGIITGTRKVVCCLISTKMLRWMKTDGQRARMNLERPIRSC